ncbi:TMhelix containing protein [Vibrio phage 1.101.O._10N.261.45.C6]|nr:TMhelix containing protein [Vibrio phage 1.101.O._10N.261.45.C6]
MSYLSILLGYILLISSTFIWVGHAIYQVVKTDLGFFSIALPNIGYWVLQIVVGIFLVGLGVLSTKK